MPRQYPTTIGADLPDPEPGTNLRVAADQQVRSVMSAASDWQADAYRFSREIGEVGYVHNLTANALASCDLRVLEYDDGEWVPPKDPTAHDVLAALEEAPGATRELMRRGALNYLIAGESILVGSPDPTDTFLHWEFLSVREVRIDAGGRMSRISDGRHAKPLSDAGGTYVARWWNSDPEFSGRPDSAMRRASVPCRLLLVLEQVVEATSRSRLSAGILAVPEGMTFVGQGDDDESIDDEMDPFLDMLIEHMSAPVDDARSAASLVPLTLRGHPDDIEALKVVDIGRDVGEWAIPLREEALRRIAAALDIPPEIMSGKGGINHWGAYNVDEDFAVKHVIPLGESLAAFLTDSYLRPMLRALGWPEERVLVNRVAFDPANIMTRGDAGSTALALWDQKIISRSAVARLNNIDEADMMDDEEWAAELLRAAVVANPTLIENYGHLIPGLDGLLHDTEHGSAPSVKPSTPAEGPTSPNLDPARGGSDPPERPNARVVSLPWN